MKKSPKIREINPDDVEYIKGDGPYSIIVFKDGEKLHSGYSIKRVSNFLGLVRVHKSYSINPKYANDIKGSYIYMECGKLPISRRRCNEVDNIVFDVKDKSEQYFLFIFDDCSSYYLDMLSVFAVAKTKEEAIDKIVNKFVSDGENDLIVNEKANVLKEFLNTSSHNKIELCSPIASGGIVSLRKPMFNQTN